MKFYIGNTDLDWYNYQKAHNFIEINFWSPGGLTSFRAIDIGSPFLLRLKSPINMIAGVGYFSSFSNIPFYRAWELYQHGNGYGDFLEFYSKIKFYRKPYNALEINPNIGCIILNNPIFFNEDDWLPSPPDWLKNTVRGKTYNTDDEIASNLWSQVEGILNRGN